MCDLCRQDPCHTQCPNFIPPKAIHYCSFCEDGIYDGELYIKNHDCDYRHYECFYGIRDLLEWLGYEIQTMEDNYD